jgi:hypothetical protein
MTSPGKETVTLLRDSPGGFDPYGDPITSTTTRTDTPGCLVAPTVSTEPTARGREGVVTGWTVYAVPGTDALFTDRVEIRGVVCRITGEVGDWQGHVVVINAIRAEG